MDRPTYIDLSLSAPSSRAPSSAALSRSGQPSPRIQHFDGDIPPVLSPLDAFAAESRRLAKELEATRIAGEKRMSRLPPQVVTKSLSQHTANRPACFRSLSTTDPSPPLPRYDARTGPEITEPQKRPKSSYPRISDIVHDEDEEDNEIYGTPREHPLLQPMHNYFDQVRSLSPNPISERPDTPDRELLARTELLAILAPPSAPFARNKPYNESSDDDYTSSNAGSTFSQPLPRKTSVSSATSFPTSPAMVSHERTPSEKSDTSSISLTRNKPLFNFSRPLSQVGGPLRADSPMKPPSRFLERKPSHLSEETRGFTSFEDDRSVMSDGMLSGNSYTHRKFILPRGKVSEKASHRVSQLFSGLSTPDFKWQEPMFPGTPPLTGQTDKTFFSAMSPTLRPSLDPGRQPVVSPGFTFGFEQEPLTRNHQNEGRPSSSHTLPEITNTPHAHPERPSTSHGPSASQSGLGIDQGISTDFQRPSTSSGSRPEQSQGFDSFAVRAAALQRSASPLNDFKNFNSSGTRLYSTANASSFDRTKMPTLPPIPGSTADDMSSRADTETVRSASTVRPTTARSQSDYQALTADEHVDKAIELHQHGDLKESTYHLRIASKQNHPTGMLLYALACRHGWGMRANPKEGVALLRRAVDKTMLEVAEDEDSSSPLPRADFMEKKSHRAQFALAIYELGVSHLNGWGVEQDKALALRCFEIAGTWGDVDALTEAGFCYAQGIGCKKNLKKAAGFYRQAADKGVSMVGNSWIYKDKYNDDDDKNGKKEKSRKQSSEEKERERGAGSKKRDKSKTRSIFGRKRSATLSEKDKEKEKGLGFL